MRTFAFALLGLLTATAAVWLMRPTPSAPPVGLVLVPAAVARTDLVLYAGRLCRLGQTNAFTELMIEHAAAGSLRSRSSISNGLLHGTSEGWHTNGQLQVTEHFKAGVSHGLRTKWHPNGVKLSEGEIVDGKFHGTFRRWYDTGSLAEQVEFADGQPHGLSLAYYPSGFLKARVKMRQGKVLEKNSWPDGETKDSLVASVVPIPAQNPGKESP
jgi:hypothetical protein